MKLFNRNCYTILLSSLLSLALIACSGSESGGGNTNTAPSADTLTLESKSFFESHSGSQAINFKISSTIDQQITYSTQDISAAAGSDYVAVIEQTVSLTAGQETDLSVIINGDTNVEGTEAFYLEVTAENGGKLSSVQTIVNDDFPSLSVSSASIEEGASNERFLNFTLTLDEPTVDEFSVLVSTEDVLAATTEIAEPGVDFEPIDNQTFIFEPNSDSLVIEVTIYSDQETEPNETLTLLVTPLGQDENGYVQTVQTANGTINNDDGPGLNLPEIGSFTVIAVNELGEEVALENIKEGEVEELIYTLNLTDSNNLQEAFSMLYEVKRNPNDESTNTLYALVSDLAEESDVSLATPTENSAIGVLSIPVGESSSSFTINLTDNDILEDTETLYVELNNVAGYVFEDYELVIQDNDSAKAVINEIIYDRCVDADNILQNENALLSDSDADSYHHAQAYEGTTDDFIVASDESACSSEQASTLTYSVSLTHQPPFTITAKATTEELEDKTVFNEATQTDNLIYKKARRNIDYNNISKQLEFTPDNWQHLTFKVELAGDTEYETTEAFAIHLENADGSSMLQGQEKYAETNDRLITYILNDDIPLSLDMGNNGVIDEGGTGNGSSAVITGQLVRASLGRTQFIYRTMPYTGTDDEAAIIEYDSTQSENADLICQQGSISFSDGQITPDQDISIKVTGDGLIEGANKFVVMIFDANETSATDCSAEVQGLADRALTQIEVTIANDDKLTVQFSEAEFDVDELTGSTVSHVNLPTLKIDGALISEEVTVSVDMTLTSAESNDFTLTSSNSFDAGTARLTVSVPAGDYTLPDGSEAGQIEKDITINGYSIVADNTLEFTESASFSIPTSDTVNPDIELAEEGHHSALLNIRNDDLLTVYLKDGNVDTSEASATSNNSIVLTGVTFDQAPGETPPMQINIQSLTPTDPDTKIATPDIDYVPYTQTVSVNPANFSETEVISHEVDIEIAIVTAENLIEHDEVFELEVSEGIGSEEYLNLLVDSDTQPTVATHTIIDDDLLTASLITTSDITNVSEANGEIEVRIQLSGATIDDSSPDLTLNLATTDGSAISPKDFTAIAATLDLNDLTTINSQSLQDDLQLDDQAVIAQSITVVNDDYIEDNESLVASITLPEGEARLILPDSASSEVSTQTYWIDNDDKFTASYLSIPTSIKEPEERLIPDGEPSAGDIATAEASFTLSIHNNGKSFDPDGTLELTLQPTASGTDCVYNSADDLPTEDGTCSISSDFEFTSQPITIDQTTSFSDLDGTSTTQLPIKVFGDDLVEISESIQIDLDDDSETNSTFFIANTSSTEQSIVIEDTEGVSISVIEITNTDSDYQTESDSTRNFMAVFSGSSFPDNIEATVTVRTLTSDEQASRNPAEANADFQEFGSIELELSGEDTYKTANFNLDLAAYSSDRVVEYDEWFAIDISINTDLGDVDEEANTSTTPLLVPIYNDDQISISVLDSTITEPDASETQTFNLSVTGATFDTDSPDATIILNTVDGSAVAGNDYGGLINQTIIIGNSNVNLSDASSSQNLPVNLTVLGEYLIETNEQLSVTISDANEYATIDQSTGNITINNDDRINVAVMDASITETNITETESFQLELTGAVFDSSSPNATITINTGNVEAIAGSDYTAISNQEIILNSANVTLADESSTQRISVDLTVLGDQLVEINETLTASITESNSYVQVSDPTGTITLTNDDQISVSVLGTSITETDATANESFNLQVTGAIFDGESPDATVTLNTANGSATADNDFTAIANQTIILNSGNVFLASATGTQNIAINLSVLGEQLIEVDETFDATISNPNDYATILEATGTITLTNDDQISVSVLDASIDETDATATETFNLQVTGAIFDGDSPDATVTLNTANGDATAGNDFTAIANQTITLNSSNVSLTSATGTQNISVSLTVLGEQLIEVDETFDATISNPNDYATILEATGTITLNNDDRISISVLDASITETDATANESFNLQVTGAIFDGESPDATVTLNTANGDATSGNDFTAIANQTITLNSSNVSLASATDTQNIAINLTVLGEQLIEVDETLSATISSPNDYSSVDNATGTITLNNDDRISISVLDASIDETDATATETFNLQVTGAIFDGDSPSATVTLNTANGDATAGNDFTAITDQTITLNSGNVSLASATGTQNISVSLTVLGEQLIEVDETFDATISNPNDYATILEATGTITLNNDDQIRVSVLDSTITETDGEATGTFDLEVTGAIFNDDSPDATVTLNTVNGEATAGNDFSAITDEAITLNSSNVSLESATDTQNISINLTVLGENLTENDETLTATISEPNSYASITDASGTITIDNDDVFTLAFTGSEFSQQEPAENTDTDTVLTVTATVSNNGNTLATGLEPSFSIELADDSATLNVDYENTDLGTTFNISDLVFTAGTATVTHDIAINGDNLAESDELINVSFNRSDENLLMLAVSNSTTVARIRDNDGVAITFDTNALTCLETDSDTTCTLPINLTGSEVTGETISADVTVTLDTVENADFSITWPGTEDEISFTGLGTANLTFTITGDDFVEVNEQLSLSLSSPKVTPANMLKTTDIQLGSDATVTITNDDFAQLSLGATTAYPESANQNLELIVSGAILNSDSPTISVDVNTFVTDGMPDILTAEDADLTEIDQTINLYEEFGGTSTVASGTTINIDLDFNEDNLVEDSESFRVQYSTTSDYVTSGTRTGTRNHSIANNDFLNLSLVTENFTEAAGQDFVLQISGASLDTDSPDIGVTFSTSTSGYTSESEDITDAITVSEVPISAIGDLTTNIDIVDDTALEDTETFQISFNVANGADYTSSDAGNADYSIIDNDTLIISFADDLLISQEDDGTGNNKTYNLSVQLSSATGTTSIEDAQSFSITKSTTGNYMATEDLDGTQESGEDFSIGDTSTIPLPASNNLESINIPITFYGDSTFEFNEAIDFSLNATGNLGVGTVAAARLLIQNDDIDFSMVDGTNVGVCLDDTGLDADRCSDADGSLDASSTHPNQDGMLGQLPSTYTSTVDESTVRFGVYDENKTWGEIKDVIHLDTASNWNNAFVLIDLGDNEHLFYLSSDSGLPTLSNISNLTTYQLNLSTDNEYNYVHSNLINDGNAYTYYFNYSVIIDGSEIWQSSNIIGGTNVSYSTDSVIDDLATATVGSGWNCVTDQTTGLTWAYDSSDTSGVSHADITSTDPTINPASIANTNNICGSSNWRVPTLTELTKLTQFGTANEFINTSVFSGLNLSIGLSNTELFYWSSNTGINFNRIISFYSATISEATGTSDGSTSHLVLLVSSNTNQNQPTLVSGSTEDDVCDLNPIETNHRYTIEGDHVTDNWANLTWYNTAQSPAVYNTSDAWKDVLDTVYGFGLPDGADDDSYGEATGLYRLPTIKELHTLFDYQCGDLLNSYFTFVDSSYTAASSTPTLTGDGIWGVDPTTGNFTQLPTTNLVSSSVQLFLIRQ